MFVSRDWPRRRISDKITRRHASLCHTRKNHCPRESHEITRNPTKPGPPCRSAMPPNPVIFLAHHGPERILSATMKVKHGLAAVVALLSVGCASNYHRNVLAEGYSDTRLAPDMASVTFDGNSQTDKNRVLDFTLLRAADLCLESGYTHFTVVSGADETNTSQVTMSDRSFSTWSSYGSGSDGLFSSPARTVDVSSPKMTMTVKFFRGKPANSQAADASIVSGGLRQKYKLS